MIEIEKDIPVPKFRQRTGKTKILMGMQPGDSFVDEGKDFNSSKWYQSAKKLNIRKKGVWFTGMLVENGVRIWRVE